MSTIREFLKAKAMSIEKVLKEKTGRQLTEIDVKRAISSTKLKRYTASGSRIDKEYGLLEDGRIVITTIESSVKTTPDFSYGWDVPHTMHYTDQAVTSTYDPQGMLEKEIIQKGSIATNDMRFSALKYDPAGSWRGKRCNPRTIENPDKIRSPSTIYI